MANTCDVCGKRHLSGNTVSHANNKTKRVFNPNLQRVRALINGAAKRIKVCTRCLRSGKPAHDGLACSDQRAVLTPCVPS